MTGTRAGRTRRRTGFLAREDGASAVELAITVVLLVIPLLNVADLANYAYRRMQVENAAQVGAHAAWTTCNRAAQWPATDSTKCPALADAVTKAVTATSLGGGVTLASGSPSEGFYCPTTDGKLILVSTLGVVGTPPTGAPADCSGVSNAASPGAVPADYVQVSVSYPYAPIFSLVSFASLLTTPITKTSWVRLQ